jgi:putative transposase
MYLTFCYRLLPSKRQHRALEAILESQRQLYNAALEERIDAYRKAHVGRTYVEQCRALTIWRQEDEEGRALPVALQRWTLKRLDEACRAFFRRIEAGKTPGFPRFRGKGRFDTFGFRELCGIHVEDGRIRFRGLPGTLRLHLHRPLPPNADIRSCIFRRDIKGWKVGLSIQVDEAPMRRPIRSVGVDLGVRTFAALSDGGFIPSLRAAQLPSGVCGVRSGRLRGSAVDPMGARMLGRNWQGVMPPLRGGGPTTCTRRVPAL